MSLVTTRMIVNETPEETKEFPDADVRMGVENYFDLMWTYVDDEGHGLTKIVLRDAKGYVIGLIEPEEEPWAEWCFEPVEIDDDYDGVCLMATIEYGVYTLMETYGDISIDIYAEA